MKVKQVTLAYVGRALQELLNAEMTLGPSHSISYDQELLTRCQNTVRKTRESLAAELTSQEAP